MSSQALVTVKTTALATQDQTADDWRRAAQDWAKNLSSSRTRAAYINAWGDFLAFAPVAPWEVTQSEFIDYKIALQTIPSPKTGKPVSQSTINQRLSALSSFFDFAKCRGLRPDNPVDGVKREAVSPYGRATWLSAKKREE